MGTNLEGPRPRINVGGARVDGACRLRMVAVVLCLVSPLSGGLPSEFCRPDDVKAPVLAEDTYV